MSPKKSGKDANHGALWSIAVKSAIFTLVTVVATGILAMTIRNSSPEEERSYTAIFSDVTSLNRGDDVRMAGVKVGAVQEIALDKRLAKVTFTVRENVQIESGATIRIQFRNLVGQRMISIEQPALTSRPARGSTSAGTGSGGVRTASTAASPRAGGVVKPGYTFSLAETRPALDLTVLFNGFRPLMKMLDPEDVNALSEQIIAVFQGEDGTVQGLLSSTASLTSTLAEKDQVIGELITSLSGVMTTINDRSDSLDTTLVTMQQLVSGLAEDREAIGSSLEGMGELTGRVATLLEDTREPFKKSVKHLGDVSTTLDENSDEVENFLNKLPVKLDAIGRTASYGSWINFYLCSMDGRIPMPEGYMGDLGAVPLAGRCR